MVQFLKTAKHEMPEHIQYGKLLKELNKVTKEIDALHNVSILILFKIKIPNGKSSAFFCILRILCRLYL